MKYLLVLRHAKSSWKDESLRDFDRPLSKRGKSDAPRMGRLLADMDLVPDLIFTSGAKRAKSTAEAVADSSGYEAEIDVRSQLYMAMPDDYFAVLNKVPDSRELVMVVGHNPGIEELLEQLTGFWERMPTAALAHLELDTPSWQAVDFDTTAKLLGIWRPREI
ncbi:MAG: SixA phosphatase family protein [Candidatus Promineifilaceae bacterium]|jgi:phosphohistidine phosphatase